MRKLLLILILATIPLLSGFAHPHTYIDMDMSIEMDDHGIAGVRHTWELLRNFSPDVIEVYDIDQSGDFDPLEQQEIYQKAFSAIDSYHYFTYFDINGISYATDTIEDFRVTIDQDSVIYSFYIPCNIAVDTDGTSVEIVTYDPTGYVSFGLRNVDDQWNRNINYYMDLVRDGNIYTHSNDFGQLHLLLDMWYVSDESQDDTEAVTLKRRSDLPKIPEETVRNPFMSPDQILTTEIKANPFFS